MIDIRSYGKIVKIKTVFRKRVPGFGRAEYSRKPRSFVGGSRFRACACVFAYLRKRIVFLHLYAHGHKHNVAAERFGVFRPSVQPRHEYDWLITARCGGKIDCLRRQKYIGGVYAHFVGKTSDKPAQFPVRFAADRELFQPIRLFGKHRRRGIHAGQIFLPKAGFAAGGAVGLLKKTRITEFFACKRVENSLREKAHPSPVYQHMVKAGIQQRASLFYGKGFNAVQFLFIVHGSMIEFFHILRRRSLAAKLPFHAVANAAVRRKPTAAIVRPKDIGRTQHRVRGMRGGIDRTTAQPQFYRYGVDRTARGSAFAAHDFRLRGIQTIHLIRKHLLLDRQNVRKSRDFKYF